MRKFLKIVVYIISVSVLLTLFLIVCNNVNIQDNIEVHSTAQQIVTEEEERILHEEVDVVITQVRCTWRSKSSAYYEIRYKSDEYNLEGYEGGISNWINFGYNLETKKIKEGDTVKAYLYSTVKGEEVISRSLGDTVK